MTTTPTTELDAMLTDEEWEAQYGDGASETDGDEDESTGGQRLMGRSLRR